MCGFSCVFDLRSKSRAKPWALGRLRHRGPDGEGIFCDPAGNAVLEHCRLAIIDPENPDADQPFHDRTGRWTIAYNGEIFNFRSLRADLERRGVRFHTHSDTEVVLLGYVQDGPAFVSRLRGMFAFAIHDSLTGDIFLARDQMGVKPLYYSEQNGLFMACSEIRPLLASPGFRFQLDAGAVAEFLAFGRNLGAQTIVEDVRRLLPGHTLLVRNGQTSISTYWDLLEPRAVTSVEPVSELQARLDDAVAAALVSDVPLALMLSGGIDSSLVAALAVRHVDPGELTAYSVAFGGPDDEAAAAASLCRELGLRHRVVSVTEARVHDELESWLRDLDYPAANPTWIASSFVARAVHDDDLKVLLTGDGGDEVFGGYSRWMKYLSFHDRVWSRTPKILRRLGGAAVAHVTGGLAGDIARRAARGGDLFVTSRPFHDDLLKRCLGPTGRRAIEAQGPEHEVEALRRFFDDRMPHGDYLNWMSYLALRTSVVEDYLQRLDKMGMRHSVEGRVPLLDPELVRWAVRQPQEVKVPGYRQKALLKDGVRDILPSEVLTRSKQGFCAPVGSWVESMFAKRHVPLASPLFEQEILDRGAVVDLQRHVGTHAFARWSMSTLIDWVERNVNVGSKSDLEAVT